MSALTFEQLRSANIARNALAFPQCGGWGGSDWATALAGETGEACNLIKKLNRGDKINIQELGKELADIVTYVDLLAAFYDLDLANCVVCKFNEVSARVNSPVKL